jgi:hypothetical protein
MSTNKSDSKKIAYPGFDEDCNRYSLSLDVKQRLSHHLIRTLKGSSDVFVSPPFEDMNIDSVLSEFDELFNANKKSLTEDLLELEMANRSKFGPRSIAVPFKDRVASIKAHFEVSLPVGGLDIIKTRSNNRLRSLAGAKALSALKNNTNSGLPYYTRKSRVKEGLLDSLESQLNMDYPCILFTRTQEGNKTRNVWGYPISNTLYEMCVYKPLLDFQKRQPYRAALNGPASVDTAIATLIRRCAGSSELLLVSIDFSSYDATVKSELQDISFDYIKSLFQKSEHNMIDKIAETFKTIPLWTPYGIYKGSHGVPSGSAFTNEVDSIAQATIALNSGFVDVDSMQIQGDDGCYLIKEKDKEAFFNEFEKYGLKPNRDKTYTSDNFVIYLQNYYNKKYTKEGVIRGVYPVYRALNRIIHLERYQDFEEYNMTGKDYFSIRAICILENCKYHPLFEDLVKFVLKYDKYSLEFSDQGLVQYMQRIEQTEGVRDVINNQRGDDIGGIKAFETYKLIRKLTNNKA